MPVQVFEHIKEALGNLNPDDIRSHTDRPVRLFLYAYSEEDYQQMESFFAPPNLSYGKLVKLRDILHRASATNLPSDPNDLEIYFEDSPRGELTRTRQVFAFHPNDPARTIDEVLKQRPDLAIPLAMHIAPFRPEVSNRIIKKIAKENALFSLATAIPDIVPFVSLPWAIGEFASDTAIITANQIRMAFLLAAAADRDIGYRDQKGEIGSIVLGAVGWRALARELVGKIPLGGGLIPKAAIAYAATRAVGLSMERYYRLGQAFTRAERKEAYVEALERGKELATGVLDNIKRRKVRA